MLALQVSLLRGDSWEETKATVEARLKGVVTTGWRFWPFVHILTYFLIPPRHRVLWVREAFDGGVGSISVWPEWNWDSCPQNIV